MDPNAALLDILSELQQMAANNTESVKHEHLVETIIKLHMLGIHMENGGNGPDIHFTYREV